MWRIGEWKIFVAGEGVGWSEGLLKLSWKIILPQFQSSPWWLSFSRDFIPSERIRSSICGIACSFFTFRSEVFPRNWPNNTIEIEAIEIAVLLQWTSIEIGRGSAFKIAVLVGFLSFNYVISMSIKRHAKLCTNLRRFNALSTICRWHQGWILIKLYVVCAAEISSIELPLPHSQCTGTRTWW